MKQKPKLGVVTKGNYNWWESKPTKRKVIYKYPEGSSPLMNLLTEFDKVRADLLKLEKKAKKLWKKIKQVRKAS